ncbi:hypothetical protein SLS55_009157 [Diplodia seriata]|uniref:RelA/SpoT domain-containing protein n=1 Tax=Diplodia seriata TaxID=420778 RepID=A0ABR3C835_9PEZI
MATGKQPNDAIEQFLREYRHDKDYYKELAEYVKELCVGFMEKSKDIDGLVTARAKDENRLEKKVNERHQRNSYATVEAIKADISDLSGVRIALFYPHHQVDVGHFIRTDFDVVKELVHPKIPPTEGPGRVGMRDTAIPRDKTSATGSSSKSTKAVEIEEGHFDTEHEKRFRGYKATHYRVRLGKKNAKRKFRPTDQIEIQVMTVFHSAWSEVEHNTLYKKIQGRASLGEEQILDGLSGLVMVSELYLEQLHTMFNIRIQTEKEKTEQFANKYELGSFLFSRMQGAKKADQVTLSSVELLRKFLELKCFDLNTKEKLGQKLNEIDICTNLSSDLTYPYSGKPNVSLLIMERLYSKDGRAMRGSRNLSNDKELCSVLMSTIISLDELFPPTSFWEKELTDKERSSTSASGTAASTQLNNLKWIMSAQAPRNVFLGHVDPLNKKERDKLRSLWNWFSNHSSKYVRFVFNISELGDLREFPQDIAALERTYHMVKDLLEIA